MHGMGQQRAHPGVLGNGQGAQDGILEQGATEMLTLSAAVDGQARQDQSIRRAAGDPVAACGGGDPAIGNRTPGPA